METKVTSTSAENMECLGDVVGRLQESGEASRVETLGESTRLSRVFTFIGALGKFCLRIGATKSLIILGSVGLQTSHLIYL